MCGENYQPQTSQGRQLSNGRKCQTASKVSSAALPTATVQVSNKGCKGSVAKGITTRTFFDQGSQKTFISQSLANKLKLKVYGRLTLSLSGFKGDTDEAQYALVRPEITLGNRTKVVDALVLNKLPSYIHTPGLKEQAERLGKLHVLADHYLKSDTVGHIDIIIGADNYSQFITGCGRVLSLDVLNTPGGLIIYGPIPLTHGAHVQVTHVSVFHQTVHNYEFFPGNDCDLTPRMWDLTNMGISQYEQAVDDKAAYDSYLNSVQYIDEKYWVRLPWKKDSPPLPNNFEHCRAILHSQLQGLRRTPEKLDLYDKILGEQLKLGFIEQCESLTSNDNYHYLPHHGVAKDSLTTPLRLVYNASSKAQRGEASLNDCLMKGPNLVEGLLGSVVSFRAEPYAYSADISKAF